MGLLKVLQRLQILEGFGAPDHKRAGMYSLMHVDVAVFWQLIRLLYCYGGMAGIGQKSGMRV
jgi:hypothetical protein